jgi:ABC-type microcin C transport system permease subunit YejB
VVDLMIEKIARVDFAGLCGLTLFTYLVSIPLGHSKKPCTAGIKFRCMDLGGHHLWAMPFRASIPAIPSGS